MLDIGLMAPVIYRSITTFTNLFMTLEFLDFCETLRRRQHIMIRHVVMLAAAGLIARAWYIKQSREEVTWHAYIVTINLQILLRYFTR